MKCFKKKILPGLVLASLAFSQVSFAMEEQQQPDSESKSKCSCNIKDYVNPGETTIAVLGGALAGFFIDTERLAPGGVPLMPALAVAAFPAGMGLALSCGEIVSMLAEGKKEGLLGFCDLMKSLGKTAAVFYWDKKETNEKNIQRLVAIAAGMGSATATAWLKKYFCKVNNKKVSRKRPRETYEDLGEADDYALEGELRYGPVAQRDSRGKRSSKRLRRN